jgi:hypothetical protein
VPVLTEPVDRIEQDVVRVNLWREYGIENHPKQRATVEALRSRKQIVVLAGGAGGGGKTHVIQFAAIMVLMWLAKAGFLGRKVVIATKTNPALADRHLSVWEERWGRFGQLKSRGVQGMSFQFHDRSIGTIAFRNLESGKRKGSEFAGGFLDEGTEIVRSELGDFMYMIRQPGLPFNPILIASNPDGVGMQDYRDLFRPDKQVHPAPGLDWRAVLAHCQAEAERLGPWPEHVDPDKDLGDPGDYQYIPFLPYDNPTYDEATFRRNTANLAPHIRKMRRLGLWTKPEGSRWPVLEEETHQFALEQEFPQGIPGDFRRLFGHDYGLAAPFAGVWLALEKPTVEAKGRPLRLWLYRERYKANLSTGQQVDEILDAMGSDEFVSEWVGDPAMWQERRDPRTKQKERSIADLAEDRRQERGDGRLPAITRGPTGKRSHKFATLDTFFETMLPDGRAQLLVERQCQHTWRELVGAVHDKDGLGDIEEDQPDHAITALAYVLHKRGALHQDAAEEEYDPQRAAVAMTTETSRRLRDEALAKAMRGMRRR